MAKSTFSFEGVTAAKYCNFEESRERIYGGAMSEKISRERERESTDRETERVEGSRRSRGRRSDEGTSVSNFHAISSPLLLIKKLLDFHGCIG